MEPAAVIAPSSPHVWAELSRSPTPTTRHPTDPRVAELIDACGEQDDTLSEIALQLARSPKSTRPDADAVSAVLRERGEPHVRPVVVSTHGPAPLDDAPLHRHLAATRRPTSRCGAATALHEGEEHAVVLLIDAVADLDPLPTRARTGSWLTFSARVRAPISGAKLFILGPRGAPRTVPTAVSSSQGGARVRARFALDQPGGFTVQLVGDLESGPAPLLEARVFADVPPGTEDGPVPGEEIATSGDDARDLASMIAELRRSESVPALTRDARLDELAAAHVAQMIATESTQHNAGDGDLRERFEREGFAARVVGENVVKARSITLAHRALHASPSHRMNLLRADYTHIGVAAARDAHGDVRACEIFAAGLR